MFSCLKEKEMVQKVYGICTFLKEIFFDKTTLAHFLLYKRSET